MTVLLAHHVELHHVPLLAGIFTVGFWCGWQAISKLIVWRQAAIGVAASSPQRS
jgi:hypothetical protein